MPREIVTFSKKRFNPLDPDILMIDIRDIAHALSLLTRGNGHIKHFYSVAQHSLNCLEEARARGYSELLQLALLIHDASEAYLSDITRPVKNQLADYRDYEKVMQDMIYLKYLKRDLKKEELALIKDIDDSLLRYELDLLLDTKIELGSSLKSQPDIDFRDMREVEKDYLQAFENLRSKLWIEKH